MLDDLSDGYYLLLAAMIKISRADARRGNVEALAFLRMIGAPVAPTKTTPMRLGDALQRTANLIQERGPRSNQFDPSIGQSAAATKV